MLSRFYDYYINFLLKCHKKPAQIKTIEEWSHPPIHVFFFFGFPFWLWWWSRKVRTSRFRSRGKFGWENRMLATCLAQSQYSNSVGWTGVSQHIKLLKHDLWPSHGSHATLAPIWSVSPSATVVAWQVFPAVGSLFLQLMNYESFFFHWVVRDSVC